MEASRVRKQNEAIDCVRELGGRVSFAHEYDKRRPCMNPGTMLPTWTTKILPEDYQRTVVVVNFNERYTDQASKVTNESLKLLRDTPHVRELLLSHNRSISDEGLVFASRLKKLRVVTLNETSVTGPGLRHIASLQSLVGLDLSNTPLTDEGLSHLKGLNKLEWLILNDADEITDHGLSHLSSLESLSDLQLRSCNNITDSGLEHLKNIKTLTRVLLGPTRVTAKGRSELENSIPGCKVVD